MHYLHSDKKVKGESLVLKGKRVSQLRVCRRMGHRTIGVQYQLEEILQGMGQKHRPRMRVTVAGCARHHPAWPPPTPGLAPAFAQRSQTYLARLGCRSPKLSPSLLQGSAHVASTVAKAIGRRRVPKARMRGGYGLYH